MPKETATKYLVIADAAKEASMSPTWFRELYRRGETPKPDAYVKTNDRKILLWLPATIREWRKERAKK